MDKLTMNYHLKLQEMCDCYLETDFLGELRHMSAAPIVDLEDDAVKYLALTIMYAITKQAPKLSLKKKGEEIVVTVQNKQKEILPAPPDAVFAEIIGIIRTILHLDEDKGELPLSLGLRNGEVTVSVKVKREGNKESATFYFAN